MAQKYYNKVVYGGKVLIDLSSDTVTPETLKEGVTAHDDSGALITGTNTNDVDSRDADVKIAEILENKTAYARGTKLTGTMPNRGAASGVINRKDDTYTIEQGYHDGSGTVQISTTEQAKLVPANIREGVVVLGVTGTMSGSEDEKPQAKEVIPSTEIQTIIPDEDYTCLSQVVVKAIPYVESDNAAGGVTVTIG